jgi:hypothetical protein
MWNMTLSQPRFAAIIGALAAVVAATAAGAQTDATTTASNTTASGDKAAKQPKKGAKKEAAREKALSTFFDSEQPLELTFTANFKRLRGDKGTNPPWRSATLSYTGPDGNPVVIPAQAKTRGIWRLKHCDIPPIRLNLSRDKTKGTVFYAVDRPKLVSLCHDNKDYEQYVLQEMQLYRVYNLLTPISHRARLLKMTYADSATGKPVTTRYAFLLDEPQVLAARIGGALMKEKGAKGDDLDPFQDALFGMFEYFISNTDVSVNGLHNAEIIALTSTGAYVPVPFDFDFSGAVNTQYATVDPSVGTTRVRERIFRGYCVPQTEFGKVFTLFNEKKDAIYALYHDDIGKLLEPDIVKETLKFYDEFYQTINDSRSAKREIFEVCRH